MSTTAPLFSSGEKIPLTRCFAGLVELPEFVVEEELFRRQISPLATVEHDASCNGSGGGPWMKTSSIPDKIKVEALRAIENFNQKKLADTGCRFVARFQGKHLYLDRDEYGEICPVCRLQHKGVDRPWAFAIYKYSSDRYDPEETWFPGFEFVDGTVNGAMKAGMLAYP